jgi:HPt (histidine-containing phosphotransfer) domain-containing protein
MAAIRKSATSGDVGALRRATHTLKGSLGTLGAPLAFRAAQRLETVARHSTIADVLPAVDELDHEMTQLARVLAPRRQPKNVKGKGTRHVVTHRAARERARRRR